MPCSEDTCMTPNEGLSQCGACAQTFCENHISLCDHCGDVFCDADVSICGCGHTFCAADIPKQAHGCKGVKREMEELKEDEIQTEENVLKKQKSVTLSDLESENTIDEVLEVLEIHHVDVGQGESTLILHKDVNDDRTCILIDGGLPTRGGGTLKRYFQTLGIDQIDHMICSHYDGDHFGGLKFLLADGFTVKSYYHTILEDQLDQWPTASKEVNKFLATLKDAENPGKVVQVTTGDELTVGKLSMKCLFAGVGTNDSGFRKQANDASVAWLLKFENFRYYTAGDLPSSKEDLLLNDIAPDSSGIHLCAFKTGHHGSKESSSNTFLTRTAPRAAFVSCGYHSYRHPNQQLMGRLKDKNVQRIYLTNCFFNRKEANPSHTDNQSVVDKSTLVARVAGSRQHLGTMVLRVDSKDAFNHKFRVGYYDDGSWGGNAGWRWVRHECVSGVQTDTAYDDDRADHVKLTAPKSSDNDAEDWIKSYEWEATLYGYRQFFTITDLSAENQAKARNKYKSPLLRFGKEDSDTTARDKDYIDAYEWLDSLIWEGLAEATNEFESSDEGGVLLEKNPDEEELSQAVESYKQQLQDEFNDKFSTWVNSVKQHETVEDMTAFVEKVTGEKDEYFGHYVKGEYNALVNSDTYRGLGLEDWE